MATKKKQSPVIETAKFVLRTIVLVGVPTVLAAITNEKPELGIPIGFVLMTVDKFVHKLPNEYRGLLPF